MKSKYITHQINTTDKEGIGPLSSSPIKAPENNQQTHNPLTECRQGAEGTEVHSLFCNSGHINS